MANADEQKMPRMRSSDVTPSRIIIISSAAAAATEVFSGVWFTTASHTFYSRLNVGTNCVVPGRAGSTADFQNRYIHHLLRYSRQNMALAILV